MAEFTGKFEAYLSMQTDEEKNMHDGMKRYCDSLEEIKLRIKTVQSIVKKIVPLESFGHEYFVDEFVFVQIRKILELIAFGSMSSNIVLYQRKYSDFSGQRRAKNILKNLNSINPDFYPQPLKPSDEPSKTRDFSFEMVTEGFLTRDDFLFLYDACSIAIHSPNPFGQEKKVDLRMSINDWMHRIASLLWFHRIKLAGTNSSWLVYLPD